MAKSQKPVVKVTVGGKQNPLMQWIFDKYILPKMDLDKIAKEATNKAVHKMLYGEDKND